MHFSNDSGVQTEFCIKLEHIALNWMYTKFNHYKETRLAKAIRVRKEQTQTEYIFEKNI